ncbi:hypothetical protein UB33_15920 [Photobacterium angustum]|nr:hypothetical protein UB39_13480 [Photobacterium angustum]KJG05134.1 hypothetical protein UB33_15920 [Photobacterium angustum]PSV94396.1 hypothetical protein CTN01_07705 [Photobacterium angustum]PSW81814.1 hypothetical protein CTN03_07215 [Photobacterium angustum]
MLGELYGWFFLNKSFQQPTEAVPSIDMLLPSLYQSAEVVPSVGNSVVFNRVNIISTASDITADWKQNFECAQYLYHGFICNELFLSDFYFVQHV